MLLGCFFAALPKKLATMQNNGSHRHAALQRVFAAFAGADADRVLQVGDENLAITDLAGLGGLQNRVDDGLQIFVCADHLDLDLGHKIDRVLGTPIDFSMSFLTPKAAN